MPFPGGCPNGDRLRSSGDLRSLRLERGEGREGREGRPEAAREEFFLGV